MKNLPGWVSALLPVLLLSLLPVLLLSLLTVLQMPAAEARAGDDSRPLLLCSTTQVADFARQVVGDAMRVQSILAAGADPHTYTPTAADAQYVLGATLCLQNGLHLEGHNWMATLAADAGKAVVTCTDGIAIRQMDYEGKSVPDPHAWFDPRVAAIYVRNILNAVTSLDAENEAAYRARAELYLEQLRTLHAWIQKQVGVVAPERRLLVTSHDAFGYFCAAYGFTSRSPMGWSTAELEGGVTPQRRQQVVDSIRAEGIHAVFVETSVSQKMLRQIAEEAGVQIGGTLYSDSMGAAGSAGEDYLGMMRENVLTIVSALR